MGVTSTKRFNNCDVNFIFIDGDTEQTELFKLVFQRRQKIQTRNSWCGASYTNMENGAKKIGMGCYYFTGKIFKLLCKYEKNFFVNFLRNFFVKCFCNFWKLPVSYSVVGSRWPKCVRKRDWAKLWDKQ